MELKFELYDTEDQALAAFGSDRASCPPAQEPTYTTQFPRLVIREIGDVTTIRFRSDPVADEHCELGNELNQQVDELATSKVVYNLTGLRTFSTALSVCFRILPLRIAAKSNRLAVCCLDTSLMELLRVIRHPLSGEDVAHKDTENRTIDIDPDPEIAELAAPPLAMLWQTSMGEVTTLLSMIAVVVFADFLVFPSPIGFILIPMLFGSYSAFRLRRIRSVTLVNPFSLAILVGILSCSTYALASRLYIPWSHTFVTRGVFETLGELMLSGIVIGTLSGLFGLVVIGGWTTIVDALKKR